MTRKKMYIFVAYVAKPHQCIQVSFCCALKKEENEDFNILLQNLLASKWVPYVALKVLIKLSEV
jgi:hypothetical protein